MYISKKKKKKDYSLLFVTFWGYMQHNSSWKYHINEKTKFKKTFVKLGTKNEIKGSTHIKKKLAKKELFSYPIKLRP